MPELESRKLTFKDVATLVLYSCIAVTVAVVVVQLLARAITGKTLGGAGVAIGVPVALIVSGVIRRRRRQRG
jgi:carbon starvation protein CstA